MEVRTLEQAVAWEGRFSQTAPTRVRELSDLGAWSLADAICETVGFDAASISDWIFSMIECIEPDLVISLELRICGNEYLCNMENAETQKRIISVKNI